MSGQPQWRPSGIEQRFQWWAATILCYGIGGGGLIYETLIDHLRNPTALVVFGGIAGVKDVLGYREMVKRRAGADSDKEDRGE